MIQKTFDVNLTSRTSTFIPCGGKILEFNSDRSNLGEYLKI